MSQKHTCYLPDVNKTSVVKHIKIATVCVTWQKYLFYFFISLKSRYRIYEHERLKIVIMKVLDLMRWFLTFPFRFFRVPFSSRIIMTRTTCKLFPIVVTSKPLENICNPTRIMIRTMTSITWPVLTMLLRKRCNSQPVFYHVIEKKKKKLMYIRAKKENPLYIFLLLPTWKFLKIQSKF